MGWFRDLILGSEERISGNVNTPRVQQRSNGLWMAKWRFNGKTYEVLDADSPVDAVRTVSQQAGVSYRYVPGTSVQIFERKK